MSRRADLLNLLKSTTAVTAIAADRIYGGDVPQGRGEPYIVFSKLGQNVAHTHQGRDASDIDLFEVRCVAKSYGRAVDLAAAVDTAVDLVQTEHCQIWRKTDEQDLSEFTGGADQHGLHTVVLTFEAMGK
jgi:hypothetical protein